MKMFVKAGDGMEIFWTDQGVLCIVAQELLWLNAFLNITNELSRLTLFTY